MIWWVTMIALIALLFWSGNWSEAIFAIVFLLLVWLLGTWIVHVADTADKTNKP